MRAQMLQNTVLPSQRSSRQSLDLQYSPTGTESHNKHKQVPLTTISTVSFRNVNLMLPSRCATNCSLCRERVVPPCGCSWYWSCAWCPETITLPGSMTENLGLWRLRFASTLTNIKRIPSHILMSKCDSSDEPIFQNSHRTTPSRISRGFNVTHLTKCKFSHELLH